jgi:hypothetical protein
MHTLEKPVFSCATLTVVLSSLGDATVEKHVSKNDAAKTQKEISAAWKNVTFKVLDPVSWLIWCSVTP